LTEGVATAQVLISGEESGNSVKAIGLGALICGLVSLCETMGVFDHHTGEGWFYKRIGHNNCWAIFCRECFRNILWSTRYICVDMILVGGAWSLILIRKAMVTTVRAG